MLKKVTLFLKKVTLFLLISIFLFILADFGLAQCPPGLVQGEGGKCVRPLEITYPEIPGVPVPKTVETGLPQYITYIFTLAVTVIGFIIFGVLIHSGILYLISTGNAEKMRDAKDRIFNAFLGGLLLLGSVLIFRTVNPQLVIMELPKVDLLEQVVKEGVYICNYKVENITVTIDKTTITVGSIDEVLRDYIREKGEKQIMAAKKLKALMNINMENKKVCVRINASGNLRNFKVTPKNETIFIVPYLEEILHPGGSRERKLIYRYAIVLHEKENFGGRCFVPRSTENPSIVYGQIENFHASRDINNQELNYHLHSVTLLRKPSVDPTGEGVGLFEKHNYEGQSKFFKPEGEDEIKRATLGNLKNNARSIRFKPEGDYVAVLLETEDFGGKCVLLTKDRANLLDVLPLRLCPDGQGLFASFVRLFIDCTPVVNSIMVLEGSRL